MFYEEWTDEWAAKRLQGVRDESGYLSRSGADSPPQPQRQTLARALQPCVSPSVAPPYGRWFGAESAAGKWSKLKGEAVEVQTYSMHLAYDNSVLASTVPVRVRSDRSGWEPGPQPHYAVPVYK